MFCRRCLLLGECAGVAVPTEGVKSISFLKIFIEVFEVWFSGLYGWRDDFGVDVGVFRVLGVRNVVAGSWAARETELAGGPIKFWVVELEPVVSEVESVSA